VAADVSFVLVTYNAGDDLFRALGSLEETRAHARRFGVAVEAIVVDNASSDGAPRRAAERFPWVKMDFGEHNVGFGSATNRGARQTEGRYLVTLNPDAAVDATFATEAVRLLDARPDVAVLAPGTRWLGVGAGERQGLSGGDLPRVDRPLLVSRLCTRFGFVERRWRMAASRRDRMRGDGIDLVRYVWGTGLVVRRGALQDDVVFPERWFLSGEEFDLCDRVRKAGFHVGVTDRLCVEHRIGASYSGSEEDVRVAARLQHAVRWELRRRRWGRSWAVADEVLHLGENALLWCLLGLRDLADSGSDTPRRGGRAVMRARYGAEVRAAMGVLLRGERYLQGADRVARRYFAGENEARHRSARAPA
jgi:N-acetylglucosaminyl-diphospho-decaprenol L-rhamnosyltransferase